jgi:hypothetical protein
MAARGYLEIDIKDWTEIKERLAKLEADMEQIMDVHLKHCLRELQCIHKKMESPRPSWTVTIIITILSSLCVGLIVNAVF